MIAQIHKCRLSTNGGESESQIVTEKTSLERYVELSRYASYYGQQQLSAAIVGDFRCKQKETAQTWRQWGTICVSDRVMNSLNFKNESELMLLLFFTCHQFIAHMSCISLALTLFISSTVNVAKSWWFGNKMKTSGKNVISEKTQKSITFRKLW